MTFTKCPADKTKPFDCLRKIEDRFEEVGLIVQKGVVSQASSAKVAETLTQITEQEWLLKQNGTTLVGNKRPRTSKSGKKPPSKKMATPATVSTSSPTTISPEKTIEAPSKEGLRIFLIRTLINEKSLPLQEIFKLCSNSTSGDVLAHLNSVCTSIILNFIV